MKKKKRDRTSPIVKKLAKMKSRRANRRRDFLENLDLEFEGGGDEEDKVDGSSELPQPPRRVENAIVENDSARDCSETE